mgnify:FL=1|tara:strand:+ start:298 stop:726 length:429 start_codon:yes stop_codon:yes gene_type:complete
MKLNKQIVEATKEDNYSSILTKIILQKTNSAKLCVFHMFEYVKPEIVDSDLFLEYLRIWDKEFYNFLILKKIELRRLNRKNRIYGRIKYIMNIILKILSIFIILTLVVITNISSLILIIKLMEFIVKFLNGNLDNFSLWEAP